MGAEKLALTTADVIARGELFETRLQPLLACTRLSIYPPFPDYDVLSQSRSPKALLRAMNETVLARKPTFDETRGWLLVPLLAGEKTLGVLLAEGVGRDWGEDTRLSLLEAFALQAMETLYWRQLSERQADSGLWHRSCLEDEIRREILAAEQGERQRRRRLMGDALTPGRFCLMCLGCSPVPPPWEGPGLLWQRIGGELAAALHSPAMAAYLGDGFLGLYWRRENDTEAGAAATRVLEAARRLGTELLDASAWKIYGGMVCFPEDFYDGGPLLPWEQVGAGGQTAAVREVIKRAVLAARAAREREVESVCGYQELKQWGLVPQAISEFEKMLPEMVAGNERAAVLLVRIDSWEDWRRLDGSALAAQRAQRMVQLCQQHLPGGAVVAWDGPDRFGVFLPGIDAAAAAATASRLRGLARQRLDSGVSIGVSVHPFAGFGPGDLLDNARKALVHTGFFGKDSQTTFDAVSLNISGDRLLEAGRLEEAAAEFTRGLQLDPDNVNLRNSLGVCYAQQGNLHAALAEFSRAAELAADDFIPHYNCGCALSRLGDTREAEAAFRRAVERQPDHASAWLQLAKVLRAQDRLVEALAAVERVLELKPRWGHVWRLYGDWRRQQGADSEAMAAYKQALRLNGNDAAAYSGLAACYGKQEANLEVAISLARRSVELEPANPLFAERYARLLLAAGQAQEAAAVCQQALAQHRDHEELELLLAEIMNSQP